MGWENYVSKSELFLDFYGLKITTPNKRLDLGNVMESTILDYEYRDDTYIHYDFSKSNNGNIVIKNKIPNNCIDYIYENAEIYDSANDEYIGDHKFSCGLVDESDEDKYKELFNKKGWIFEKYIK